MSYAGLGEVSIESYSETVSYECGRPYDLSIAKNHRHTPSSSISVATLTQLQKKCSIKIQHGAFWRNP